MKILRITIKLVILVYVLCGIYFYIVSKSYITYPISVSKANSKDLNLFISDVKYQSLSKNIKFNNVLKFVDIYIENTGKSNIVLDFFNIKPKKTNKIMFRFIPKNNDLDTLWFIIKRDSSYVDLHCVIDTSKILNNVGYFYSKNIPKLILDSGYFTLK